MGSNVWVSHIAVDLYLEVRALLPFINPGLIRPVLEYGSVLYSGAALTHLNRLNRSQARVENMCGFTFPHLTNHRNASILGLTCRLLAGEGRSSVQSFCRKFKFTSLR